MNGFALFILFLQAVLLSQSGWASVAIVRDALVEQAMLSDGRLTAFLALSQVTPGPLGFYLLFVGYSVSGWIGALAAWLALVLPSFLVVPIMRVMERRHRAHWLRGATTGIVVGSAALMFLTASTLAESAISTPTLIVLAGASMLVLTALRVPSLVVVVLGGGVGLVVL